MASDAALERLRAVYENYAHGDFWADGDIWHEDVELVWGEGFLDTGIHRGLEGLPEALVTWLRAWERWEAVLEELRTAPDGRVVALVIFRGYGRRGGAPVLTEGTHVWTFDEHDLVTRLEIHPTRAAADEILGDR